MIVNLTQLTAFFKERLMLKHSSGILRQSVWILGFCASGVYLKVKVGLLNW